MTESQLRLIIEHPRYRKMPRHFFVTFALYCANDIRPVSKQESSSIKLLDITQLWLEGKATDEEVEAEIGPAWDSDSAAYYAACTVNSEYSAAVLASSAAEHASRAAPNSLVKLIQYKNEFMRMLRALSKVEKLIYEISDNEVLEILK